MKGSFIPWPIPAHSWCCSRTPGGAKGNKAPRCAAVTVGVVCCLFIAVANCRGALLSKETPETAQMWDDWSTVSERAQRIDTEQGKPSGTTRLCQTAVGVSVMTRFHGLKHDVGNLVYKFTNNPCSVTECADRLCSALFFSYASGPGFEDRSAY